MKKILISLLALSSISVFAESSTCDIQPFANASDYYITKDGQQFGDYQKTLKKAVRRLNVLKKKNECTQRIVSILTCEVLDFANSIYYIKRDGRQFTEMRSSLKKVIKDRDFLIDAGLCSKNYLIKL